MRPSEESSFAGLSGRLSPCWLENLLVENLENWKIGATFPKQHFREKAVDGQTQSPWRRAGGTVIATRRW